MRRVLTCCLLLLLGCRSAPPAAPPRSPAPAVEPRATPEPPLPADPLEPLAPPPSTAPASEKEAPSAPPAVGPPAEPEPDLAPQPELPVMPAGVRVGLASDLPRLTLPCCDSAVTAQLGERSLALVAPIEVQPAAGAAHPGFFRLQVAALKDQGQAEALARQMAAQLDQPADARFDAAIDLYRVRVGRYTSREAATAAKERLVAEGLTETWVASEGGGLSEPGLRVTQGGDSYLLPGRWLTLASAGEGGIRFQGERYRGTLRIYLNNRGTLNLVNELPLEDYLRGVVPKEMGPVLYDQLEALKAQAVAARTYTVRHLGEFAEEGFDICATPRCQVYGGMEVEHPLSDRAVAETAGEVAWFAEGPINAMYTATCGGHTENSEVVFPLIRDPYLRGVSCLEAGLQTLDGTLPAGRRFPGDLMDRLLPPAVGEDRRQTVERQLRTLGELAGLVLPDDHLRSLERRELQRFVASLFDLAFDARLFVAAQDVPYLLQNPPPDWGPEELRQAAHLVQSGLLDGEFDSPLNVAEVGQLLLRLAKMLYVLRLEEVSFLSLDGRTLVARGQGEERRYLLPPDLSTFRRLGDAPPVAARLSLVSGDRLELYLRGDRVVALVQQVDPQGVPFDRGSQRAAWTRFRSDAEIAQAVQTRYPGLGFEGFEVLARGDSGRVSRIRLLGRGGRRVEVEGLAVRWLFDLPETLFTARRLTPEGGQPGWLFRGRGWGHGVGLCQVGAFGMAQRGHSYRDILAHYYRGVEIRRLSMIPEQISEPLSGGARR